MEADGTILIDTEINADGMKPGSKQVEDAARRMAASIDDIGKRAQKFVDDYVNGISEASKTNNEFKKEIIKLSESLKNLEKKGLYFGDQEYDNAYLKLQKVQTALKDYKNELLSPTPNAKLFNSSSMEGEIEDLTNKLVKLREQGFGFGDSFFDSTFKNLSKIQEKLKSYKSNLTKKEEPIQLPVVIDTSTMEGQINLLKAKLQGLKNQQKGFGDTEYDATALGLKRAEQALINYKKELFKTDKEIAEEIEQQNKLNKKLEETKQKEEAAAAEAAKLAEIGKNAEISNLHVVRLKEEIQKLAFKQKELEKAGVGPGYKEYDKNATEINRLNEQLKHYTSVNNRANKSTKKINESLKATNKSANRSRMSLSKMLGMSILFSMTFRAMSVVATGIKEGLDNIAQYSNDANAAMSMLMSSITYLKNAFATFAAPIIELVAPAMSRFINLMAEAVTWTAQLIAALTGKDTFVKAVKVQQDYAESLDKTGDAAKKAEKLMLPFDQLIQETSKKNNDNELSPEDMFTTEIVNNDIKLQAEEIKNVFASLFEPLKKSWMENGPVVLQSLKGVFSSINQLASDIASSFMQVWNIEGYGKTITDDLLISFSNFLGIIENLITQFNIAWTTGNTGTNILRNLGDILLIVTGFFRQATEIIKNWSANIDFSPLLVSFNQILSSVKPIVSDVSDTLLWLLNNVLLPIGKWGIEQTLPAVFQLIASALDALHNVVEALKPLGLWLWEQFLKPLGEWTGQLIIDGLKKVSDLLSKFSDWVKNNQKIIENAAIVVAGFFAAWKSVELLSFIQQSGGIISAIGNITTAITGSTLAKLKDKSETITLTALYAKDFLVSMVKNTAEIIKQATQFAILTGKKMADAIAQKSLTVATTAWNAICKISSTLTEIFSSKMATLAIKIAAVIAVFKIIEGLASLVSKAWDKMTPAERTITKIIAVAGAIALAVAAAAAFVHDYATLAIAGSIAAIAGLSIYGISSSANKRTSSYSASQYGIPQYNTYAAIPYNPPMLATGTVVPPRAGISYFGIGDNNHEPEVVSPLSTMKQAFKEAISEMGGMGRNQVVEAELIFDRTRFGKIILELGDSEKKRVGVRMVTGV